MKERVHDSDGHNRPTKADDIRMGVVLRMVSDDKGVAPFSDTVVIGIVTTDKKDNKKTHASMAEAMEFVKQEFGDGGKHNSYDYKTIIHLARPYLYASSIGICFNSLMNAEKYSVNPYHILKNYHVVEMSTGEVAISNIRPRATE